MFENQVKPMFLQGQFSMSVCCMLMLNCFFTKKHANSSQYEKRDVHQNLVKHLRSEMLPREEGGAGGANAPPIYTMCLPGKLSFSKTNQVFSTIWLVVFSKFQKYICSGNLKTGNHPKL